MLRSFQVQTILVGLMVLLRRMSVAMILRVKIHLRGSGVMILRGVGLKMLTILGV